MWRTCALFMCVVTVCAVGTLATTYVPADWFRPVLDYQPIHRQRINQNITKTDAPRVAIDFYVMSKCPDAAACITTFQPAIASISSIADVTVNFIATYIVPDQFQCMHGPTECAGNLQQICAEYLFPNVTSTGSLTYFDFIACQEADRPNIPNNGQSCASKIGIDWDELNSCATTQQGFSYLADSIARTNVAKQTVSCTINLEQTFWCQHNGPWVNCNEGNTPDALVKSVCSRYQGSDKPAACQQ